MLWAAADAFVAGAGRPGDVNQALIELGSTICKVRDPACGACPLQRWCVAHARVQQQGAQDGAADSGWVSTEVRNGRAGCPRTLAHLRR